MNNKTALSKDDIDVICIHLNAIKENLCNQGRYCEAEEYQQLIDKVQYLKEHNEKDKGEEATR